MLPGFTADNALYQSRVCYVSAGGVMSAASDITPALSTVCASSGGRVSCGTVSGIAEGIFWGALIGSAGGAAGALVGGLIGGLYCWLFGCD